MNGYKEADYSGPIGLLGVFLVDECSPPDGPDPTYNAHASYVLQNSDDYLACNAIFVTSQTTG